jgi:hypothetical protein
MLTSLDGLNEHEPNRGFDGNFVKKRKISPVETELGEFFDLFCTVRGTKPLAALDYSVYGQRKYQRMNLPLINQIIEEANRHSVQWIHNSTRGGIYLKTLFFHATHRHQALALAKLLWDDPVPPLFAGVDKIIAIGILLGYSAPNIIGFLRYNYDLHLSLSDLQIIEEKVLHWCPTLSESDLPLRVTRLDKPIPSLPTHVPQRKTNNKVMNTSWL